MNIEESIKILDKFTTGHKLFNIRHSDGLEEAIETLLTAYEKEKEKNKELENKLLKIEDSYEEIIKRKSTYLTRKYEAKIKSEKELTKIIKNLENRLNQGIKISGYDITADVDVYLKLLDYKKGE